jgi:dihydroxyacid dehydratase/phosphogluconate dehydratase
MSASWPVALNSCWPNIADFGAATLPVLSLAYAIGHLTPARVLSRASFENAMEVAMSRRAGEHCAVSLDDFDAASRKVPEIANIRPSGDTYLMEDFYYAGGMRAMMSRLTGHLKLDAMTVSGCTMGENLQGAEVYNDDVIRPLHNPIYAEGALAVLRGNLAPDGCVIKPSACAPQFLQHTGPALVFDDENLDVTADHVMVLRNASPQGGPGMPEWGMLPIPLKLVKQGVKDMLRISDARMSGTSYGACILHVAPEACIGGTLALVKTGDLITVDVPARRIHMEGSDEELAQRRAAWTPQPKRFERGYGWMAAPYPAGGPGMRF